MTLAFASHDIAAGAVLTIDLSAVRANYRHIRDRVRPAAAGAVVKANAYGLGAVRVVTALLKDGCRDFFVAQLSEARELRAHLPSGVALYVLNGLQAGAEAEAIALGVTPALNTPQQVAAWAAAGARLGRRLPGALQVDTGMSRLGLSAAELTALRAQRTLDDIDVVLLMSHLACADEPLHAANAEQLAAFRAFAADFSGARLSLANSGGALLDASYHNDLARPGIALYGVHPQTGAPSPLRPVVRLDARVIQVREIAAGTGVGYGLTFHAAAPTRLATIGVGYADGWPRCLGNRGAAFFNGIRLPIAGRVSMDSMTLDISALPAGTLNPGDSVELIGPHQSLDDVAGDAGTIAYEILTSLGQRYARIHRDDDSHPTPHFGRPA
ncbi:alanine racemase [Bradyrhizobium sp. U87765 SZCCT0131]|uniref:alanine racemase n=1 Tax=unclassified Bradyrhizobium TaxID=2631580 RepID=UPI001BADA0B5|nr:MULTISPECIES: alanine racemase [unclassified Bradyrhizobium]MBR1218807.1 alanine racemase [Bradyrhizobium sp. U87765 SZCCT0131]MBR1261458.1 alanine racemase [Bradyrhizobium sp. U87765 SZCCT0134]MBR1306689.1 alanine racemase [Bradyrhizobium sp. U87765 SZCCT0110]MBR1317240.1 alanine racemase [Bradyrhizobium sp. U87765 SZCCT0109]MBR1350942.1 alanine racemase [Bradyrhizobium sp. U87765 SZCCT0048]